MYGRTAVGSFFILSHAPPNVNKYQLKRPRRLHYGAVQLSLPVHLITRIESTGTSLSRTFGGTLGACRVDSCRKRFLLCRRIPKRTSPKGLSGT